MNRFYLVDKQIIQFSYKNPFMFFEIMFSFQDNKKIIQIYLLRFKLKEWKVSSCIFFELKWKLLNIFHVRIKCYYNIVYVWVTLREEVLRNTSVTLITHKVSSDVTEGNASLCSFLVTSPYKCLLGSKRTLSYSAFVSALILVLLIFVQFHYNNPLSPLNL